MDLIKLLPRYLLTFGPWWGLWLFLKVEWLKSEKISISELNHSFFLRHGTTDIKVFREVFLFRCYALSLANPKIIIDGGGNIGLASLFFAAQYPLCKIYSVEPSSSNFRTLVENTKHCNSIIPVQSALWNKDTHLKIRDMNENQWAFTVEECTANHPEAFQATSLASLMKLHQIDYIDLLKLDIEGAERELFSDNYEYWIVRTRCIVIELHDWIKPDCSKFVFKTVSNYNFKTSVFNGMLMLVNSDIK